MEALSRDLNRLAISSDSTLYQPSSSQEETQSTTDDNTSQATCAQYPKPRGNTEKGKVTALQWFMDECSIGPLGSVIKRPWSDASTKTHDCYIRKASEIIAEVLKTVAPESAPELWEAVRRKDEVSQHLESVSPGSDLLLAVVESYKQADTSEIRRQLLSLVAGKMNYPTLTTLITRLSRYEFTAARRYVHEVGAGLPLQPAAKQTREKVDSAKLDHFLDFITSSNIVQDLPFGRKTLTLSSGTKIDIPNVIRTVLPSRLIKQYNQYCSEDDYTPLSTRTLFRILSEACVASVRKSLQGLDSYAAEGGRGFDDLLSLFETLAQYGANEAVITELKDNLRYLKQYIKSDYKVKEYFLYRGCCFIA